MPASHIIILVLTCVLIALAFFTVHQINVREERIAKLEAELTHSGIERRQFAARCERLHRRHRAEYERANDAEARVLSRNIFDEVANEYAWLQFPTLPGASASAYHFMEADLYDAALNSHEVR
jgi:hypothetical protein